ncbi:hypothetical protein BAY59_34165 [Prauserella coralliicola]|uniref:Uncharacterized protein n=1 Tax=Prauserella muralis TaxID=588067 RepID=A0A2V4AFD5_9PSEU|nr:hypothetical protein BAY60_33630 [Prauserella muralis]PXY18473.1 hypothetical protein BAY59_34165 [Prauserella coralliicola]
MENDRAAIDDGEFVVASCQATPLFEQGDAPFDNVAAAIIDRVEGGRTAAAGTAAGAVPGLVGRLGDHRRDAAIAQMPPDRSRGISLVAADTVGPGPSSTTSEASDTQLPHQMRKHRRVPGLAGPD